MTYLLKVKEKIEGKYKQIVECTSSIDPDPKALNEELDMEGDRHIDNRSITSLK